jgi:triacylglycerol lipase
MNNPLVLVHGFLATRGLMLPMARRLEAAGYAVYRPHLSPLCVQDLRLLGSELQVEVERVLAETGARQVELVGVSQGGLIALYYLKRLGGAARAARFVAVGSPFGGTWAAAAALPLLGALSEGIWQTLPDSPLLAGLSAGGAPEGVPTACLALAGDPVCPPERCGLPGAPARVLPGPASPFRHQDLVLRRATAAAIVASLKELGTDG